MAILDAEGKGAFVYALPADPGLAGVLMRDQVVVVDAAALVPIGVSDPVRRHRVRLRASRGAEPIGRMSAAR